MQKVLIVDDNFDLSRLIHSSLVDRAYRTKSAATLSQAFIYLTKQKFDLLILDRGLPDGDGLEIIRYLQLNQSQMPILMISERTSLSDRIEGLRRGADDYLPKPFSMDEFSLKVEKLLMKVKHIQVDTLPCGDIAIFPRLGICKFGRRVVHLRKREFEILVFLIKHKNMIVTREMLIDHIWEDGEIPTYSTVDVYIRRIRIIMGSRRKMLQTVRGYGYVMRG